MHRVRHWIRSVFLRRRLEREMQEEMAAHLERARARLMARGLSAEEAAREARREFGNIAYLQERAREARGGWWVDVLVADARFAFRQFRRKPATMLAMLAILALGMSICTLLFSFVHSYAVQPPPGIAASEDLVRVRGSQTSEYGRGVRTFSYDELEAYRRLTDHFRAVAGWADATVTLDIADGDAREALVARATFVTGDYFAVLGVRPVLGPGLPATGSGDPAEATVAVIGHAAWDRLFGRSPDVIGRTLDVNGVPITIVGVAPARFIGVGGGSPLQLWLPLSNRHVVLPDASAERLAFRAAARLRPGVEVDAATAAVQVVAARAAASRDASGDPPFARGLREPGAEVVPLLSANGDPNFEQDVRRLALSLGVLGLLVLLVTCTNVSALLTGLAVARRKEIAIRLSLGAARTRVIRQLLTESALLSGAAAVAALGIVWIILRAVATSVPILPLEIGITWPALTFTFGVALAAGTLFGLAPAFHATRRAIATAVKDSTTAIAGTRLRLQRALVVAQIAFTQPLIVALAAVLLLVLGEFQPPSRSELADRLIALRLSPAVPVPGQGTASESDRRLQVEIGQLLTRLESTPGVAGAAIDSETTRELGRYSVHPADRVAGGSQAPLRLSGSTAAPGYFAVVGIPLLRGREFAPTDVGDMEGHAGEVPVIIGGDAARRWWPGADPVGRRLQAAGDSILGAPTLVVVGVAADADAGRRDAGEGYRIYLPIDTGVASSALLVRTVGDAEPLIPIIRRVVQEEVPGMVADVRTVAAIEYESRRTFRMVTGGITVGGLAALFLSAIGLYAVVAFAVGQRAAEIAIRMAVGASARRIAGRFLADGLRLGAFGLALGLPVSLLGLRAVNAIPDPGVPSIALPPVTVVAASAVLLVATAASLIPARRAAGVDPASALRRE